jgi:hypothetical protein
MGIIQNNLSHGRKSPPFPIQFQPQCHERISGLDLETGFNEKIERRMICQREDDSGVAEA